jgi:hypothetical protein
MALLQAPLIVALNTSTHVAITLPNTNQGLVDVAIWTEDGTAFLYDIIEAGTNAVTVPTGRMSIDKVVADGTPIMWAKASAGTPNLIVQAVKHVN